MKCICYIFKIKPIPVQDIGKSVRGIKKVLRLKWSNVSLVDKPASRGRPKGSDYTAVGVPRKQRGSKKKMKKRAKKVTPPTLMALTDFPKSTVDRLVQVASQHVLPKYIAGNIAHFMTLRRTNPVTNLVQEIDESDDDFPNISCELLNAYPNHSLGTYSIASAMLVLSRKYNVDPTNLIETLQLTPSRLHTTAKIPKEFPDSMPIGNYTLTSTDTDSLKPSGWLNDNVSTFCINWYDFFENYLN